MLDLSEYTDDALIRTFAALTHRMDKRDGRQSEHRQQRDLVQAEILRRMSE